MSKYRVWIDVATAAADRREREKWTLWCLAQLQKWPSILEYTAEQPKLEASANSRICEAKHSTPTTELRKCVSQLYYRSSLGLSQEKKIGNTIHGKKYRIPQNKWPISLGWVFFCFDTAVVVGHSTKMVFPNWWYQNTDTQTDHTPHTTKDDSVDLMV